MSIWTGWTSGDDLGVHVNLPDSVFMGICNPVPDQLFTRPTVVIGERTSVSHS